MSKINLLSKLKNRYFALFIILVLVVIMLYVIFLPSPSTQSSISASNSGALFQTNLGDKYTPTKFNIDNFNLPQSEIKVYTFKSDIDSIFNRLNSNLPGMSAEIPDNSNLERLFSTNYVFTFNKSLKYLTFYNHESMSSIMDGYDQSNALKKFSNLLGVNMDAYKNVTTTTNNQGYTSLAYTIKLDGINLELQNNNNANLHMIFSKEGKLVNFDWTILEIKEGVKVKQMDQSTFKTNFEQIKKYFYKDPIEVNPNNLILSNNQGVPLNLDDFKGSINIKSSSLIYFVQPDASSYIIPVFKLRALYTQDSDKKDYNGFVYVPAYIP